MYYISRNAQHNINYTTKNFINTLTNKSSDQYSFVSGLDATSIRPQALTWINKVEKLYSIKLIHKCYILQYKKPTISPIPFNK